MKLACLAPLCCVLFFIGCDTAGPSGGPLPGDTSAVPSFGSVPYDLRDVARPEFGAPFAVQPISSCKLQLPGIETLHGGSLRFDDTTFRLDLWASDTLRRTGSFERHGPLLSFSAEGHAPLFATLSTSPEAPTTIRLHDPYGSLTAGARSECAVLRFGAPGHELEQELEGPAAEGQLFLVDRRFLNASQEEPGPWRGQFQHTTRLSSRPDHAVSEDSARIDLRPNGTYSFRLWYEYPLGQPNVAVHHGQYIKTGPLYAFDPETAHATFGVEGSDILFGNGIPLSGTGWWWRSTMPWQESNNLVDFRFAGR